jgi:hypothetical protein
MVIKMPLGVFSASLAHSTVCPALIIIIIIIYHRGLVQ